MNICMNYRQQFFGLVLMLTCVPYVITVLPEDYTTSTQQTATTSSITSFHTISLETTFVNKSTTTLIDESTMTTQAEQDAGGLGGHKKRCSYDQMMEMACLNNGTCFTVVGIGIGCICVSGWDGRRCEAAYYDDPWALDAASVGGIMAVIGLVVILVIMGIIFLVGWLICIPRCNKKKDLSEGATVNGIRPRRSPEVEILMTDAETGRPTLLEHGRIASEDSIVPTARYSAGPRLAMENYDSSDSTDDESVTIDYIDPVSRRPTSV